MTLPAGWHAIEERYEPAVAMWRCGAKTVSLWPDGTIQTHNGPAPVELLPFVFAAWLAHQKARAP